MKKKISKEPQIVYTMAMRDSDWSFAKVLNHLLEQGLLVMGSNGYFKATQTIEITCASRELTEMFHCEDRLNMFNEFLVFPEYTTEYGNVIIIQKWDDDKAEDYSDYI